MKKISFYGIKQSTNITKSLTILFHKNKNLLIFWNRSYLEYQSLHDFCIRQHRKNRNNVLIIDEVQLCDGFEKAINSLHAKRIYDIYLTGSNAFLLSSDLATLFTGRTIEIEVLPFSFSEYLEYFERNDIQDAFDDYFRMGGMPGSYEYHDETRRYDYIADIYHTIIERDLFQKYKLRNRKELMLLSDFMLDNISNLTSPHTINLFFMQKECHLCNTD